MEDQFIPYNLAVKLKGLCFNEEFKLFNNTCYFIDGNFGSCNESYKEIFNEKEYIIAPLYQQVFDWFRKKHSLIGSPQYFINSYYCYTIDDMQGTPTSVRIFTEFESYNKARLECLNKLIEICEKKIT